jgi:hypothetical protein
MGQPHDKAYTEHRAKYWRPSRPRTLTTRDRLPSATITRQVALSPSSRSDAPTELFSAPSQKLQQPLDGQVAQRSAPVRCSKKGVLCAMDGALARSFMSSFKSFVVFLSTFGALPGRFFEARDEGDDPWLTILE